MAINNNEFLKRDFMVKRSQMKRFKNENYKNRWFILYPTCLTYYEGTCNKGPEREKGCIDLRCVTVVEKLDPDALNRPNAFQVVYTEQGNVNRYSLYIVATHKDQQEAWIKATREACVKCGAQLSSKYHTGVYIFKPGRYSCCSNIGKHSDGCAMSTTPGLNAIRQQSKPLPPIPGEAQATKQRFKVVALYDYNKAEDGDLTLVKGEEYDVIDNSRDHWWEAINHYGEKGHIPANYVEKISDHGLGQFDWYYKNCTRMQCEEILRKEAREGCFIVRDSSQKGMYSLSIYTTEVKEGVIRHYHIRKINTGEFYLSERHTFTNIPDLIYYHQHNSAGLVVRLRYPPSDRTSNQPATAGFGHDMWELDPRDLEILEDIGRGQFGKVHKAKWRGRDAKTPQFVAVKMMKEKAMLEDDFIDEAKTMKRLQHPSLVQLYGVVTQRRPIYIVIEYMRNGSLLNYLKQNKHRLLPNKGTLMEMCASICSAMEYLESNMFIHRDLAARNCLVGENSVVKVGDFGLARYVLDDEYVVSSSSKLSIRWVPPEVLERSKFSSKADVWAFGVTVWEIFSGGELPYGKMNNNADVVNIVLKQNRKLDKPRDCPSQIYEMMLTCWQKKLDRRPSFKELHLSIVRMQEVMFSRDYVE